MYKEQTELSPNVVKMKPTYTEKDPGDDALDALSAELDAIDQTNDPEAVKGNGAAKETDKTTRKLLKTSVAKNELSSTKADQDNHESSVGLKKAASEPGICEGDPDYSFPSENPQYLDYRSFYSGHSSANLNQFLARMSAKVAPLPGETATPYNAVRAELCAISIVMNKKGEIAPGFRQMVRSASGRGGKVASKLDEILSRDRQVIDLDWVARHQNPIPDVALPEMFNAGFLNYKEAEKFSCRKLTAVRKLAMLGLEPYGEVFLSFFRSKEVELIAKKDFKDRFKLLEVIKKKKVAPHCRVDETAEHLRDINTALLLCSGDLHHANLVLQRMGHAVMSLVTLKRKRDWLKKIGVHSF